MIKDIFWLHKTPEFWSRLAAKITDYALFYIVSAFISWFFPFYIEEFYYVIFALLLPLFWMPVEALCIAKWGTTPGKKLFGLQVRNHLGGKLPYWISLKRSSFIGVRPGVIKQKTFGWKRKLTGFALCFISIFGAVFEQEFSDFSTGFQSEKTVEGWVNYTSEHGGFRVIFPTDPQEEKKLIPLPEHNRTLNYNELKSYQDKKVYYSVSYMKLPRKWKLAGSSRILQGALDGIVEHSDDTKLVSKQFSKHKSYRTLDFHISQKGEDVQGRLIMVGTTLYRLTVTYPPSLAHQLQHKEFLDSFDADT
jgi:uncharacterized RDD family membrane protein YckC